MLLPLTSSELHMVETLEVEATGYLIIVTGAMKTSPFSEIMFFWSMWESRSFRLSSLWDCPPQYPLLFYSIIPSWGFPAGTSGKEPTSANAGDVRHGFDLWVRKIPWRKAWRPTPAFLLLAWRISWTEEPGGLQSMGHKESDTTEAT